MTERTSAPSGRQPAGALVRLSSFKGILSVNPMSPEETRKANSLRDLKSQAAHLAREIGAMQLKVEFYAADCSDGPDSYRREMGVHIDRNCASLAEIEALIAELEAMPVQLSLSAV
ncbi:MAG: hypothetical protein WC661_07130 [Opitutaceae bacterium]|jgi:hypothetical protein